jgi:hypothetical protein
MARTQNLHFCPSMTQDTRFQPRSARLWSANPQKAIVPTARLVFILPMLGARAAAAQDRGHGNCLARELGHDAARQSGQVAKFTELAMGYQVAGA